MIAMMAEVASVFGHLIWNTVAHLVRLLVNLTRWPVSLNFPRFSSDPAVLPAVQSLCMPRFVPHAVALLPSLSSRTADCLVACLPFQSSCTRSPDDAACCGTRRWMLDLNMLLVPESGTGMIVVRVMRMMVILNPGNERHESGWMLVAWIRMAIRGWNWSASCCWLRRESCCC